MMKYGPNIDRNHTWGSDLLFGNVNMLKLDDLNKFGDFEIFFSSDSRSLSRKPHLFSPFSVKILT